MLRTFTMDDFLDALDLEGLAALFRKIGFQEVNGGRGLYVRPQHSESPWTGEADLVTIPDRSDPSGFWREGVRRAARAYSEMTGRRLWWIPQTEDEAAYASLLIELLYKIRTQHEHHDDDRGQDGQVAGTESVWDAAQVVTTLRQMFTELGLDVQAEIDDPHGLPGEDIDPFSFLTYSLSSQLKERVADEPEGQA